MLKPSANQLAKDCRGPRGVNGVDSPRLALTNHGPCFFFSFPSSSLFLLFSPRLVCLCRAGFSQLCSPRRAFSEQGPLRLIKSASFFSGWRCQLHALCVRVGIGSISSISSSAGSESLERNTMLVWPLLLHIITHNMCSCTRVYVCSLPGAGGCSCSPAVLGHA